MAVRPDIAVANYIGQNVERLTLGTDLFHGPPQDKKDLGVYCTADGGFSPVAILGGSEGLYTSTVNVVICGERGKYSEGLNLARSIQDAIQFAALGDDYISSRVETSEPVYMGENRNGGPEWFINLSVKHRE